MDIINCLAKIELHITEGKMDREITDIVNEKNIEEIRKIKEIEEIDRVAKEIKSGETVIGDEKITFEERTFFDGKIKAYIPKEFGDMDEEIVKLKYPSERRAQVILSDLEGVVSILFNYTGSSIKEEYISEFKDEMKSMIGKSNASIIFGETGVKEISGKKVGYFEFVSPAIDTDMYNLMFFCEIEGKVFIGTFNCTEELSVDWKYVAKAVMKTITITEEK